MLKAIGEKIFPSHRQENNSASASSSTKLVDHFKKSQDTNSNLRVREQRILKKP
ncbi:hypothetical protein [Candidatus Williamhamiltonella defendens]|uniref:hypothetical protein n=1 Tax=Candidatus Williamhamiltonella defendens TaxID=138072 RepID=UPI0013145587|nr:hypothetical protein [Candidatus Hamiltonella defensa]